MSNRKKMPQTYSQRARAAHPGYVVPGAPCDVPGCAGKVSGSRTLTFVAIAGPADDVSVLARLCLPHMRVPTGELRELLPVVAGLVRQRGEPLLGSLQSLAPDSAPDRGEETT